ncbi:hypothetical protein ADUPG1_009302 [Aduncisulcus paluster]|uniref:Spindle assembly abnormal protein 6 N-terminal domain-containing protein n=1 Tax=Aduncisulcus paluster TaxID=2918883 RepID=A0ABQ5KXC8_9EUKA|nr:hypothetical protein ADUPG1_009302 [Aduncisulcus paluster]
MKTFKRDLNMRINSLAEKSTYDSKLVTIRMDTRTAARDELSEVFLTLTMEDDVFFGGDCSIDVSVFASMAEQQQLRCDFTTLPSVLERLINFCRDDPRTYYTVLHTTQKQDRTDEGVAYRLEFIQDIGLKYLTLIYLEFRRPEQEKLEDMIRARYVALKSEYDVLRHDMSVIKDEIKKKCPSVLKTIASKISKGWKKCCRIVVDFAKIINDSNSNEYSSFLFSQAISKMSIVLTIDNEFQGIQTDGMLSINGSCPINSVDIQALAKRGVDAANLVNNYFYIDSIANSISIENVSESNEIDITIFQDQDNVLDVTLVYIQESTHDTSECNAHELKCSSSSRHHTCHSLSYPTGLQIGITPTPTLENLAQFSVISDDIMFLDWDYLPTSSFDCDGGATLSFADSTLSIHNMSSACGKYLIDLGGTLGKSHLWLVMVGSILVVVSVILLGFGIFFNVLDNKTTVDIIDSFSGNRSYNHYGGTYCNIGDDKSLIVEDGNSSSSGRDIDYASDQQLLIQRHSSRIIHNVTKPIASQSFSNQTLLSSSIADPSHPLSDDHSTVIMPSSCLVQSSSFTGHSDGVGIPIIVPRTHPPIVPLSLPKPSTHKTILSDDDSFLPHVVGSVSDYHGGSGFTREQGEHEAVGEGDMNGQQGRDLAFTPPPMELSTSLIQFDPSGVPLSSSRYHDPPPPIPLWQDSLAFFESAISLLSEDDHHKVHSHSNHHQIHKERSEFCSGIVVDPSEHSSVQDDSTVLDLSLEHHELGSK